MTDETGRDTDDEPDVDRPLFGSQPMFKGVEYDPRNRDDE